MRPATKSPADTASRRARPEPPRGELRLGLRQRLLTSSPLLSTALDLVPRYRELAAAAERARELVAAAKALTTTRDVGDALDGVRDALVVGDDVDVDALVHRVHTTQQAATAAEHVAPLLERLASDIADERDHALRDGIDIVFAALDKHLAELGDHVARLDKKLGAVADADYAITLGRANEWHDLIQAIERYNHIRTAQFEVLRTVASDPRNFESDLINVQRINDAGLLANAVELYPKYRIRHGLDPARVDVDGFADVPRPSWPEPSDDVIYGKNTIGAWRWPTYDKPAYLRWLFRPSSPAQPWVPGYQQMFDHFEAMQRPRSDVEPADRFRPAGRKPRGYLYGNGKTPRPGGRLPGPFPPAG